VNRNRLRWAASGLALLGVVLLANQAWPSLAVGDHLAQWWPLVLVLVGLIGVLNLAVPIRLVRAPLLIAVAGAALVVVVRHPWPGGSWAGLLPLAAVGIGFTVLVGLAGQPGRPRRRHIDSALLIAQGRRIEWGNPEGGVFALRAVASGAILTVAAVPAGSRRLEITAIASDVDVIVPPGWAVFVDSHRVFGSQRSSVREAASPDDADLRVFAFALLGSVNFRSA
jgi:hypothetical protein